MERELSSVVAPKAMVPVTMPTLSVMAVTAAVVVGAVVSTVAVTAGEVVRAKAKEEFEEVVPCLTLVSANNV